MDISLVLKSAIFENGNYQHFFAGEFAQGSRVRKGENYFKKFTKQIQKCIVVIFPLKTWLLFLIGFAEIYL